MVSLGTKKHYQINVNLMSGCECNSINVTILRQKKLDRHQQEKSDTTLLKSPAKFKPHPGVPAPGLHQRRHSRRTIRGVRDTAAQDHSPGHSLNLAGFLLWLSITVILRTTSGVNQGPSM